MLLCAFLGFGFDAFAEDLVQSNEAIKAAVTKSVPLLEAGARGSMEKRKQRFTCHNQALPVMALITACSRGITIDAENLRRQVQFTDDFLVKNRTNYLAGKSQGGQALTAGYALWTLEMGGWKSDETTAAVADYLLDFQNDLNHWKPQTVRPPSEESLFTVSSSRSRPPVGRRRRSHYQRRGDCRRGDLGNPRCHRSAYRQTHSAREPPGPAGGLIKFDGSGKHHSHRNEGGPVSPHPGPLPEEREKRIPRWG